MDLFTRKLQDSKSLERKQREEILNDRRKEIFDSIHTQLEQTSQDLEQKVHDMAGVNLVVSYPGDEHSHYYAGQIIEYANRHDYYFNRILPKGWFTLLVQISPKKVYRLIVSLHHYGYDDSTVAIGAILEFGEGMQFQEWPQPTCKFVTTRFLNRLTVLVIEIIRKKGCF
jgi:hypothetical protein